MLLKGTLWLMVCAHGLGRQGSHLPASRCSGAPATVRVVKPPLSDLKPPNSIDGWNRDVSADIDVAETYIRHHEERYRTPLERIAGWRYNPTVPFCLCCPGSEPNPGRTLTHPSLVFRVFQAYRHTYLWTTKTLYYFWRDFDKATVGTVASDDRTTGFGRSQRCRMRPRVQLPVRTANSVCYMNIINPADVGLGEGALYNLTQTIR